MTTEYGSNWIYLSGHRKCLRGAAMLAMSCLISACSSGGNADTPSAPSASSRPSHDRTGAPTGNAGTATGTLLPANPSGLQPKAPTPRLVKPTSAGISLNSAAFRRLYGPGVFNQDSLSNTIVGIKDYERIVSNRFMAMVNAPIQDVRVFLALGGGYSAGHGGLIEVGLYPDDGTATHLPNLKAAPLASTTYRPMLPSDQKKEGRYPLLRFSNARQALKAGKHYHLVFRNIDPAPGVNFISTNNSTTHKPNGRPSRWLNRLDWATLYGTRPAHANAATPFSWKNLTEVGSGGKYLKYFSPILDIGYANGQRQGVSDFETGAVDLGNTQGNRVLTATANRPVRERFTPGSNKLISGFSVATAASVGGNLHWQIRHGGSVLAQGTLRQPRANYQRFSSAIGEHLAKMVWYDVELPSNIQLKARQHYDLQFTPQGRSQWKFADHRNGSDYEFRWPAAFTESQAQHWNGTTWVNTYHWNHQLSGKGSNWPVVLHLAP